MPKSSSVNNALTDLDLNTGMSTHEIMVLIILHVH